MMTVRAVAISISMLVLALLSCGSGPSPEEKLRRAVIDFNGHVVIMKSTSTFVEYRDVSDVVRKEQGVVGATPFIFVEGTLNVRGKIVSIAIKGTSPDETPVGAWITPKGVFAGYRPPPAAPPTPPAPPKTPAPRAPGATDPVPDDFVEAGDEEPTDFSSDEEPPDLSATDDDTPARPSTLSAPVHAVIGVKLARELNVSVGDVVDFIVPPPIDYLTYQPKNEPPTRHAIRIVGTIETGAEYDERMLLTTFETVQALLGRGDVALGIEVRISDERAAARVAKALAERLGEPPYTVMDWCELNRAALKCEL